MRAAQGIPDGLAPEERRKRYLWRVAKILIEELDGVPIKDSGTFLGLLHGKFPEAFLEAIELTSAEGKRPGGEYRAYLTATCQRLAGERASQHNKQATLEAGNDAAAAAFKQSLKTGGSNA